MAIQLSVAVRGHAPVKDELGRRYGRLTVLAFAGIGGRDIPGQGAMWTCLCDCGNTITTRGSSLRNGSSKSCGCVAAEKLRASVLLPESQAARNQALRSVRLSAASRAYECDLSDEFLLSVMERNCFYCGAPPSNLSRHPDFNGSFVYNGLDRVDNTKGYSKDNVVACCKHCNYSKRDRTTDEFADWIVAVYNHYVIKENK